MGKNYSSPHFCQGSLLIFGSLTIFGNNNKKEIHVLVCTAWRSLLLGELDVPGKNWTFVSIRTHHEN